MSRIILQPILSTHFLCYSWEQLHQWSFEVLVQILKGNLSLSMLKKKKHNFGSHFCSSILLNKDCTHLFLTRISVKLSGEGQIHSIFCKLHSQEVQSHTKLCSRCCNSCCVLDISLSTPYCRRDTVKRVFLGSVESLRTVLCLLIFVEKVEWNISFIDHFFPDLTPKCLSQQGLLWDFKWVWTMDIHIASFVRFCLTKYYDLGGVLMKYSSIFLATCCNLS